MRGDTLPPRPSVTACVEFGLIMWTSGAVSLIVRLVILLHLIEFPPVAAVAFVPPAAVWTWGLAVERLAIGIDRFDDAMKRRRDREHDRDKPG